MISRIPWVLFMCSMAIALVACTGGDSDPAATATALVEEQDPNQRTPTAGFAEVAGLRDFIDNDLDIYDEFLQDTISPTWKNDWAAYDYSIKDFAKVDQLFAGTNPFSPGTLIHYFSENYPQLEYATITLDELPLDNTPRKLYFREDLTLGGSEINPVVNTKQRYNYAEGRAYWGVKNIQYDGDNKPYVPFLMLVDEAWWARDGLDGEPKDWVSREYLMVFKGKLYAYGSPRIGTTAVWPYTSGVPGDAIEGEFWLIRLANFNAQGDIAVNTETSLVRYDHSYLKRETRYYSTDSMVADVEPNNSSAQALFVPIGYSSGEETHSLQVGSDSSDNFLISAIAGCDDGVQDPDTACNNPVVLATRIGVTTSHPTAQLRLELIDAAGDFGIFQNNLTVSANGEKFIIFDATQIQINNSSPVSYDPVTIGQKLIVRVSLLNPGEMAADETVNYRLRIVGQE